MSQGVECYSCLPKTAWPPTYPIHPGKGVGKSLPDVGRASLIGIVDSSDSSELFTNRNIRLDLIMNLSKVITEVGS